MSDFTANRTSDYVPTWDYSAMTDGAIMEGIRDRLSDLRTELRSGLTSTCGFDRARLIETYELLGDMQFAVAELPIHPGRQRAEREGLR
jgi:hypothetical protein